MQMVLSFLFGWGARVRKLRKRWDREREKALRKKNPQRKMVLQRLDAISTSLTTLEESQLNRLDRARLAREVELELEEIGELLKMKPEEIAQLQVRKEQNE